MMVLSTGSLSFVRENMKTPLPDRLYAKECPECRAPIGGAADLLHKGNSPERQAAAWTLIGWPDEPRDHLRIQHPDAKVALDQVEYAVPWFDTYNTVAACKAI
jgi:sn-glycerol 3-phosphate transport system substrate-binding protein